MEVVMVISRIDPGQRYSGAVVHGDLVFLAGHVGSDPSASVLEQTRDVLRQLDARLAAAGTDKSRLLSVQVWLSDISTFGEMNEAWDAWVDRANLPARATVEARLASPDYKVEISGIAAR
jgi:enamine deaminase RidA (YjgF/YER057c/UK114 family)